MARSLGVAAFDDEVEEESLWPQGESIRPYMYEPLPDDQVESAEESSESSSDSEMEVYPSPPPAALEEW